MNAPMVRLTFRGNPPSKKNSKRQVKVRGRTIPIPSKAHEKWHKEQSLYIRESGVGPFDCAVEISYDFYVGGKDSPPFFDLFNAAESINDLLEDCGIIPNDSYRYLPKLELNVKGFVRGEGRVEVTIEPINYAHWAKFLDKLKDKNWIKEQAKREGKTQKSIVAKLWEGLQGKRDYMLG